VILPEDSLVWYSLIAGKDTQQHSSFAVLLPEKSALSFRSWIEGLGGSLWFKKPAGKK
jgi:hypothetical protein